MIQIPPNLPDPTTPPRRPESANVQAVPAVLADKAGVNPGVVLNLPSPVLETPTDGMRPRDATSQPGTTQIDNEAGAVAVRQALGASGLEVTVRPGLNTAGLPERLMKLLAQMERLSGKTDVPVMWPQPTEVRAARPEQALFNLRRVLGDSMMFEMRRLQARLVPSAAVPTGSPTAAVAAASPGMATTQAATDQNGGAALIAQNLLPEFETVSSEVDAPAPGATRLAANLATPASAAPSDDVSDAPQPAAPADKKDVSARKPENKTEVRAGGVGEQDDALAEVLADDESSANQATMLRKADPLNADSQAIKDAVRLLLHGELRWQGELSPGVFARLLREDVWEEDPHAPGALIKGTLVSVDLDLPALGRLRVRGMFIKDSVRVTVLPQEGTRGALQAQMQDLRERLIRRGLDGAQVRLAEDENG